MRADETSFGIHVDCDNLWVYETSLGLTVSAWQDLIYTQALPLLLEIFTRWRIKATFFVIGKELERPTCVEFCLRALAEGHRIGNHSLSHPIDFARLPAAEMDRQISAAHERIVHTTGLMPIGFRAPLYSFDRNVIAALARLGYRYDSSVLPGPGGYIMKTYLSLLGDSAKGASFGPLSSIFARSNPHRIDKVGHAMWEFPLATFPVLRLPIHSTFVYRFGERYLWAALFWLRRVRGHHIYLLHAIDALNHPASHVFGGRLIPLTWSHVQRRNFLDRLGSHLEGSVSLTEDVVMAASANDSPLTA